MWINIAGSNYECIIDGSSAAIGLLVFLSTRLLYAKHFPLDNGMSEIQKKV